MQIFGVPYAMRIWVKPDALVNYNMTIAELQSAIRAQNAQVAAGQLGGAPQLRDNA